MSRYAPSLGFEYNALFLDFEFCSRNHFASLNELVFSFYAFVMFIYLFIYLINLFIYLFLIHGSQA
jgi:hypothetical protein